MDNPHKTIPYIDHDGRKKKPLSQSTGKKNLQKIIPIRVSQENWEQIKKEADRRGLASLL